MDKKGSLDGLVSGVLAIVVVGVVIVVGLMLISQGREQIEDIGGNDSIAWKDASVARNATFAVEEGIADFPAWFPLIVIVIIGAVIIGLVKTFSGRD